MVLRSRGALLLSARRTASPDLQWSTLVGPVYLAPERTARPRRRRCHAALANDVPIENELDTAALGLRLRLRL